MKLLFVEHDGRLSSAFKENTNYQIFQQESLHLLSMSDADILIVDNVNVSHNELLEKKEYFEDFKEIFFVTENQDIVPFLMINKIKPILALNPNIVLQTIEQYIYTDNLENRVFVFMGTDRKTGVTSITHAIAENLSSTINKKVLLINLSDNCNEMLPGVNSIDQLKNSLRLDSFSFNDMVGIITPISNYYYIGASSEVLLNKIDVDSANRLYRELKSQTEYIVILDIGASPSSPFYIVALDHFKNCFLITKPQISYQRVFDKIVEQVLRVYYKLDYKNFITIVNGNYDYNELLENYNVMFKVKHTENGLDAENKGIPLHKLDAYFNEDVQQISNYIAYKTGYQTKLDEKKKGWFSKIFKKNKEGVNL